MTLESEKVPEELLDDLVRGDPQPKKNFDLVGFEGLKGFTEKAKPKGNEEDVVRNVGYLMQHHSEIFNVTPPNAKAEDKMKANMVRYPLKPVETQQMRWKGFRTKRTDTVLDHITRSDRTMKSSNEPSSQRT